MNGLILNNDDNFNFSLKTTEEKPILIKPPIKKLDASPEIVKFTKLEEYICRQEPIIALRPLHAEYKDNRWFATLPLQKREKITTVQRSAVEMDLLEETGYYKEAAEGIFGIKNDGEEYQISNARIRIQARILQYTDEHSEPEEYLECLVFLPEHTSPKTIEIPRTSFKNIYSTSLKEKLPEIYLSVKGRDCLDKYLSAVYQYCQKSWQERVRIHFMGWTSLGGDIRYVIGDDAGKRGYQFPDITRINPKQAFIDGFSFLEIGDCKAPVLIPFIFSHFAYLRYFVKQAQHDFESVLFVRGESNSKKTSVMSVLADVFRLDRKRKLSFGSTPAALYTTFSQSRDQIVLLDDFSCSEKDKKRADTHLFELAIRAVGDSSAPAKMKDGNVDYREFRSTLIITGEDNPALSASSYFRVITVAVNKTSYDGTVLTKFQRSPDILRRYFGLFIEFLRQHSDSIIELFGNEVDVRRAQYKQQFLVDRICDAAINLIMVGQVIHKFAIWCGVTDSGINACLLNFEKTIMATMLENQQENRVLEPEIMFLYALRQVLETRDNLKLADTEETYCREEKAYVGFKEEATNTLWLRHEDIEQIIKMYWEKQGHAYTISSEKLRKLLYERGISQGVKSSSGKLEYLKKAKKGSRKRMLVINNSAWENIENPSLDEI